MDADISRKTIVGPAMAAPVTLVAANHAKEEETNVAEMIADAVIHQRSHFRRDDTPRRNYEDSARSGRDHRGRSGSVGSDDGKKSEAMSI